MNHNDHDSCTYVCIYLVFRRCCGCSCTQLQTHFRSLRSAADKLTATLASRGTQTIGTSRHRYQSQSHFAIALELADRLYHYIWQFKLCQNNPSALWLVVAPIALLARFVAIKHLPACATVWPPNWPTAQPPTRNSKTAKVAWHQVERHGTFAQQILFACNTYVIITMIMEFEVVSDVAVLVDAEPSLLCMMCCCAARIRLLAVLDETHTMLCTFQLPSSQLCWSPCHWFGSTSP